MKRAYSSGNCTGFTPDSLLCLSSGQMKYGTIADTKVGKNAGIKINTEKLDQLLIRRTTPSLCPHQ